MHKKLFGKDTGNTRTIFFVKFKHNTNTTSFVCINSRYRTYLNWKGIQIREISMSLKELELMCETYQIWKRNHIEDNPKITFSTAWDINFINWITVSKARITREILISVRLCECYIRYVTFSIWISMLNILNVHEFSPFLHHCLHTLIVKLLATCIVSSSLILKWRCPTFAWASAFLFQSPNHLIPTNSTVKHKFTSTPVYLYI